MPALSKYNISSMTDENIEHDAVEETTQTTEGGDVNTETLLDGQEEGESLEDFAKRTLQEKADLSEKNKQLYERAKKTPKAKPESNTQQVDNIELMEFFAKGNSKEDYYQLQAIMKGKDLPMEKALEDPLYKSYLKTVEQEKRSAKAQLGASGGSPGESQVNTSDMSPEEHKEYFNEVIKKAL